MSNFVDYVKEIRGIGVVGQEPTEGMWFDIKGWYTDIFGNLDKIDVVANIETEIISLYNDKSTLDSLYADKAALDSLFADKLKLDSLFLDKSVLDSLYADKITLDGLYADKTALDSLFADKIILDSLYTDKVKLSSLYADKAELDSLYADKATLDSLHADKATLDSIFADKSKLDSLFADKVALDSIYADKIKLDSIYSDKLTLDAVYANEANINIVANNIGDINSYANSYYSSLAVEPTIVSHPTLSVGDMYFDTILNEMRVYDGTVWKAAADTYTKSEIDAGYATKTLSTTADLDVLNKVKNVDGAGSGLDADTVDGHDSTYFGTAASVALKLTAVGAANVVSSQVSTSVSAPSGGVDNDLWFQT